MRRLTGRRMLGFSDLFFRNTLTPNYLGVLVDMKAGSTLLDLAAIKQDLEDMLDCRVHIVTEAMLNGFREQVMREAVRVRSCDKG